MRSLVVVYDITDDKRRTKLFKTLEGFGIPVQFSVFHCELDEENLLIMRNKVDQIINRSEDSVIYYDLCPRCRNRIEKVGIEKKVMPEDIVII